MGSIYIHVSKDLSVSTGVSCVTRSSVADLEDRDVCLARMDI